MACRGARDWSRFHGTQCAKDKPAVPSWEARIYLLDRNFILLHLSTFVSLKKLFPDRRSEEIIEIVLS